NRAPCDLVKEIIVLFGNGSVRSAEHCSARTETIDPLAARCSALLDFPKMTRYLLFGVLLQIVFLATGCSRSTPTVAPNGPTTQGSNTPSSSPWFKEVAGESGLNFRHSSGHKTRFYLPEMMSGGAGLLDYDGDGLLDIYCVNGGSLDPVAT